jgi:hypothetical protein
MVGSGAGALNGSEWEDEALLRRTWEYHCEWVLPFNILELPR